MPSFTLTLDHFSQPVPVCELTANAEEVITLLKSGQHEIIVVVSQQRHPLGVVQCQHLLSHLLNHSTKPGKSKGLTPSFNLRSLMQPIATLPAQMESQEFLSQLKQHQAYALVDQEGKFLALLDSWKLLQSLLIAQSNYPAGSNGNSCTDVAYNVSTTAQINALLKEWLEQLPLPVMLYSTQQQIIYQNRQWREQIDETTALTLSKIRPRLLETDLFLPFQPSHSSPQQMECLNNDYYPWQELAPQLIQTANQEAELEVVPCLIESSKTGVDKVWRTITVPFHLSQIEKLNSAVSFSYPSVWLVLAMDVTNQQQCNQELAVKNADLIHLNRLKDEFLACISHELKSPLTAVVGLSTLLKEQKIGELNSRQVRYAELIYRSGRQLMTLVNDLLDLTRLETGQLKLTPTLVSISNVCQRAYDLIQEKYQLKTEEKIPFSLEIEPELEHIVADEVRLQQMLVHLLDNALKFTQSGGQIGLKVNHWQNWLAFTIWDTGIGIPEDSQHLIFQKFQQLENPLTRQFEGAGLGLVLTQRLAKAHGGDISFVSQAGQGSQFTLLLPPQPLAENWHSNLGHSQKQNDSLILAIEAMPMAINHLTEQLNDLGYQVIIARTGTEAIEKARQLQPKRIFLSPTLPLLSGWDVLTLLKSDPQTKTIPVVMMASAQAQRLSEQKGADNFITLPVTRQALQEVLSDVVSYVPNQQKSLTILRLYETNWLSNAAKAALDSRLQWVWSSQLPQLNYRLLEADSLEQAEMIASVWNVDVLLIDETVAENPKAYLQALSQCDYLATIPLVTLDTEVTEAANQIEGLSVFPCLLPNSENCLEQLLQVIQIAVETRNQ